MGNGIWKNIIRDKYLDNVGLEDWIMARALVKSKASFVWCSLMKSRHWMCCNL